MTTENQSFTIDSFLSTDFSEELNRFSAIDAQKALYAFYYDFSIQDWNGEEPTPTPLFASVSGNKGELSPDNQFALISYLAGLNWNEQTILNVIISYLKSTYFQHLVSREITLGNDGIEELLAKDLLNSHLNGQIPDQIYKALYASLILFCTEFDVSDGKIDAKKFKNVLNDYSAFEND